MPLMNDVGRIGRDAELRYTPNGNAVLNLALACDYGMKGDDGKRPTQWVEISVWGKQAEGLVSFLVKGQQVSFTADDVHIEEYQTQGATRSKLVGRCIHLKLVGSAPQQQQAPQQSQQQRPAQQQQQRPQQSQQQRPAQQAAPQPQQNFDDFDDDIPF